MGFEERRVMKKNENSTSDEDWRSLRIMHPQGLIFKSKEKETENGPERVQR